MKRTIILISMLLVFFTLTVIAQPKQTPWTKEFEKLNIFVGTWQSEGKVYPGERIPPIETKGEAAFEWVMSKTWLMWSTVSEMFSGYGLITWDNEEAKYIFFWFDNFLTQPSTYQGKWKDSQTLEFKGKIHARGKVTLARIVWKFVSESEAKVIHEVSSDGKNFRVRQEATWGKKK